MERQVTIATFDDLALAHIARGKLESADILCFLVNEHLVGVNPLFSNLMQGVGLTVFERDAAIAHELLTGDLSRADLTEEDRELAPDLEEGLFEPNFICPRCRCSDIKEYSLRRPLLAVTYLLFGAPLAWNKSFCKCRVCGHTWRD